MAAHRLSGHARYGWSSEGHLGRVRQLEAEQAQPGGDHGLLELEVLGQLLEGQAQIDGFAQLGVLLGGPGMALGDRGARRDGNGRVVRHGALVRHVLHRSVVIVVTHGGVFERPRSSAQGR